MADADLPLTDVAQAIADGRAVDWLAVEGAVGPDSARDLVRYLGVVHDIVAWHQRATPALNASVSVLDELREDSVSASVATDLVPVPGACEPLTSWGHLCVIEPIGSGAFGEVYRARDTHLDRDVALKLLRRRESRRTRGSSIVEEGRLLARVRHPNVITVYGADRIGDHVGLWMEFIDGRTLEQELQTRGPFNAEEVTRIGIDLCRALAAVHRAGLLHRDIKAQNVMRDRDGRIVLMDFGAGREDVEDGDHVGRDLAGTPLYLAPEIFQRRAATIQSDVYSLGVLLYRLATGSYPVNARTLPEVRVAHERGEGIPLRDARPDLPNEFADGVERALAHNPSDRYESANEMEAALGRIVEPSPVRRLGWTRSAAWLTIAALGAAVLVAVALRPQRLASDEAVASSVRSGFVIRRASVPDEVMVNGTPSPDGRYFPYTEVTTGNLIMFDLKTREKRPLTHFKSADEAGGYIPYAIVSADSRHIAYTWAAESGQSLRIIDADGSHARTVYEDISLLDLELSDWARDGKEILAKFDYKDGKHQMVLVSVVSGSVRVLKTMPSSSFHTRLSPDGRYVAYDAAPAENMATHDIYLLATDGTSDVPIIQHPADDAFPMWTPDGKHVLFSSSRAGRMGVWSIEMADGHSVGSPQVVNRDMGRMYPMSLTQTGSYYYSLQTGMVDVQVAELDPVTGKAHAPPSPVAQEFVGSNISPDWSHDGRYLAFVSQRSDQVVGGQSRVLVVRNVESGQERTLSPPMTFYIHPRWAPDGRSIFVKGGLQTGVFGVHQIDIRTGNVLSTPLIGRSLYSVEFSPDGRTVFYTGDGTVAAHDLESGRERVLLSRNASPARPYYLAASPDGRSLAVSTLPKDGPAAIWLVSVAGGVEPRELYRAGEHENLQLGTWTTDGKSLLFVNTRSTSSSSSNITAPPLELWRLPVAGGPPETLGLAAKGLRDVRLHPDGRRIAFTSGWPFLEVWVMENFLSGLPTTR